jgi:hypothetical protein
MALEEKLKKKGDDNSGDDNKDDTVSDDNKKKRRTKAGIEIPYIPEKDNPVLHHVFSMYPVACSCRMGLFSDLTGESFFFNIYPLILSEPTFGGKKVIPPQEYYFGAGRASHIFTGLRKAFTLLYPQENGGDISRWDVYKWNLRYYGKKISRSAESEKNLLARLSKMKQFGGTDNLLSLNEIEECQIKRYALSLPVRTFYEKFGLKHIPLCGFFSQGYLQSVVDAVKKIMLDECNADKKVDELLDSKDMKNDIENVNQDSSSEDDEDDTEEPVYVVPRKRRKLNP